MGLAVSVPAAPATAGVLLGATTGVILFCRRCGGVGCGGGGRGGPAAPVVFVSSSPFRHSGGMGTGGGLCRRRRPLSPNTEVRTEFPTLHYVQSSETERRIKR